MIVAKTPISRFYLVVSVACYCENDTRDVICGSSNAKALKFSCDKICDKDLTCGNHKCEAKCHGGSCLPCKTSPDVITRCNCGKTPLTEMSGVAIRKVCTDVIPICDLLCGKELPCGTTGKFNKPLHSPNLLFMQSFVEKYILETTLICFTF